MSVNFEVLAQSHAKLCLFKVQNSDANIRPFSQIKPHICLQACALLMIVSIAFTTKPINLNMFLFDFCT